MAKQESLNPRSYKSIRNELSSGKYRTRGELMRAVAEAFRAPRQERIKKERARRGSQNELELQRRSRSKQQGRS